MNTTIIINIFCIILLFVGLLGTFLPILPGLLLSVCGLLIYKYGTHADLPMIYIWAFGILTAVSIVLNYVIPAKTNSKYGGTQSGSTGSVVGTIVGIFTPIPLGFLIGMLVGTFIGELHHDSKNIYKALQSTKGTLIGFIYGTGFSFLIGLSMLLIVLLNMFKII